MKYYVEIRKTTRRRGPPVLVPLSEAYNHQGFRSVYAFPETLAKEINITKTTRGLRGRDVYSEELFLDFDDNPEAARAFRNLLVERGASFTLWNSGGRSHHFHIPLVPMTGADVPQQQKKWVARNAPGCDLSIYHASAMYRLPYTFHEKNLGSRKNMVQQVRGRPLKISEKIQKILSAPHTGPIDVDKERSNYTVLLLSGAGSGNRRPHLFKTIACGVRSGREYDRLLADVIKWNARRAYPSLGASELESYVQKTYEQLMRECKHDILAQGKDDRDLQEEDSGEQGGAS